MRRINVIAFLVSCLIACGANTVFASSQDSKPTIKICVDKQRIGIGQNVNVSAQALLSDGKPAAGYLLLPYLNGKLWGPREYTNSSGKANLMVPLPNAGIQEISVRLYGKEEQPNECWLWSKKLADNQTVYFQKTFNLDKIAKNADLWVAADDHAVVYINGTEIIKKDGWNPISPVLVSGNLLHKGQNAISITAVNDGGPASMIARLDVNTLQGKKTVVTDSSWSVYENKPEKYPNTVMQKSSELVVLGSATTGVHLEGWPGVIKTSDNITGFIKPENGTFSNVVQVRVDWRKLKSFPKDPEHLIGYQWEEWFTPHNSFWQTAQAVPLMGFYQSYDPDVLRQQTIWMIESGADFMMADWSNNIWFLDDWDKRAPGFNELQLATSMMLENLAKMKDEGQPIPKFSLLIGISHVLPKGVDAVNGQLNYIYLNYIMNPRFEGLWQEFDGKPLIVVLDLGAEYLNDNIQLDDRFTIRYMGSQLDQKANEKVGLWSWMDRGDPVITYKDGKPEATTVSAGYFGAGGWLYPPTKGHRNGATLIDTFRSALNAKPKITLIHQFNEFAGQIEGQGYGEKHDLYVDSYSSELSDDIEPTSLTSPAYRGNGGWGYLYLNYMRALVDLYKQKIPETTVIAISSLLRNEIVKTNKIKVEWSCIGKPAKEYVLKANGKVVASNIKGNSAAIDLSKIPDGIVKLTLVAEGTKANYIYSWTTDSEKLSKPVCASSEVDFILRK